LSFCVKAAPALSRGRFVYQILEIFVHMVDSLTLQPVALVNGTVNLPGSKSVSNRALLLAALAEGTTTLTNLLDSDDVRHMLNALQALGVSYQLSDDRTTCTVEGVAGPLVANQPLELFLGNAGTAMRPLAAALCLGSNDVVLTGEPRMKERPIGHLVDALRQGGAQIDYLEQDRLPAAAPARWFYQGGDVTVDGSVSSQFLTALLMTAPLAKQDTTYPDQGRAGFQAVHRHHPASDEAPFVLTLKSATYNYRVFRISGKQQYLSLAGRLSGGRRCLLRVLLPGRSRDQGRNGTRNRHW
jgi:3-phosphoshikimate 1-carboxyvinyltransferase